MSISSASPPSTNADTTSAPPPSWLRRQRNRLFLMYLAFALVGFVVLLVLVRNTPYFGFDLAVTRAVQTISFAPFAWLMEFISALGFAPLAYILVAAIFVLLLVMGWRWAAVMSLFAAAGVYALGSVIKVWVHRARPSPELVHVIRLLDDFSFPSIHVLTFTAFLGFLWYLLYVHAPASRPRTAGLWLFGLLIALIGLSRIYVGQHWLSDVLAGYFLGSLWLALTILIYRRFEPRFGRRKSQRG